MRVRALRTVILRDGATDEEYRLVAGTEAPALPERLASVAEANGYIEPRSAPVEKSAPRRREKEGE